MFEKKKKKHRGNIHSVILLWLVLPRLLSIQSFLFDFGNEPVLL